ncbi:hypothetical protein [Xanthocytophaga agilis]|uniref:Polymerase nucleotidyl transferase domain-containing protein n=1 Tax=Xanthocytophaga agilis TaxID=3048010 RepID=A0AAE3UHR9_9BACT|nr:hypothetical protein [Xanthocytophaga agilis]MDJ1505770.1 hypothetical protein [Xanthocytophaga agilis]
MFYYSGHQPSNSLQIDNDSSSNSDSLQQTHPNDFFLVGTDGFFHSINRPLPTVTRIIIDDLVKQYTILWKDAVISVYLRGSHLNGEVKGKTDFDTVVVLKDFVAIDLQKVFAYINNSLQHKYPFIKYFDTYVINESAIANNRYLQFVVSVLSMRVYGEPIEKGFTRFKPNKDCIFLLHNLPQKLAMATQMDRMQADFNQQIIFNHVIKHLLRSAQELVLEREKCYTRNITLCQSLFARYYPDQAQLSHTLLKSYNVGQSTKLVLLMEQFSQILREEYGKLYPAASDQLLTRVD